MPRRLLETVEAAGLQTTTWTIAFAGRYATGSNLVFVLILAQDVRRIRGPLGPDADDGRDRPCHHVRMSNPLGAIRWPVRTDRLEIRPATTADLEATWRFRRLEDVGRWLTRAPADLDAYRSQFEDGERLAKTLVVELDGAVIGDLMLQAEDGWAQWEVADRARGVQAELGWVLHPDHAGRGYATEAVRELIRVCFEDLGLRRVTANCFADNLDSRRLMERLGMRREVHTIRESLHRSGEWLDGMGYALLADEWRSPEPVTSLRG